MRIGWAKRLHFHGKRPYRWKSDRKAVEKMETAFPQFQIIRNEPIHRLSYSHLELIGDLDNQLKRTFYKIECIRGNWSVWELKRQMGRLSYKRSGLSKAKKNMMPEGDNPPIGILLCTQKRIWIDILMPCPRMR